MLPIYRCCSCLALGLLITAANASDFEVRNAAIDVRELEYDLKLSRGSAVHEVEYGVNAWWSPAIEAEWTRSASGERSRPQSFSIENRFRLAGVKRSWALGLFTEYEHGRHGGADAFRVGPVAQMDIGPTVNVLDLTAVKEWGRGARRSTDMTYAWQTRWRLSREFQPGIELYGGALEAGVQSRRQSLGGPVFFGVIDLPGHQDLRYEIGYLHDFRGELGTVKALLGYEYRF